MQRNMNQSIAAAAASHAQTSRHYRTEDETLAALRAGGRPILLAGASVITMDPTMGDWESADLLIGGDVIVGVGPGLLTAAADDGMIVIDCKGCVVFPAAFDLLNMAHGGSLTPGNKANVVVCRIADAPGAPGVVPFRGSHLDLVFNEGKLAVWGGQALDGSVPTAGDVAVLGTPASADRVGLWVDENDFLRQELLADGRYDEARGDRPSAYQGRYWIKGDRITYLDDLGFWAFGDFQGDDLLHAGYRMRRR
jgi:hypothetical protein